MIEIYPQKQNVPIGCFHVASSEDWSRLFNTHLISIMQMYRRLAIPSPVATLHESRSVKRPQTGQCGNRQVRAFIKAQCPAIIHCFKNRRRASMIVILSSIVPPIYHKRVFVNLTITFYFPNKIHSSSNSKRDKIPRSRVSISSC